MTGKSGKKSKKHWPDKGRGDDEIMKADFRVGRYKASSESWVQESVYHRKNSSSISWLREQPEGNQLKCEYLSLTP